MATSKAQQKAAMSNSLNAAIGGISAGFVNGIASDLLPAEVADYNGAVPAVVGVLLQLQKSKNLQTIGLGMTAVGASALAGSIINGFGTGGSMPMRTGGGPIR